MAMAPITITSRPLRMTPFASFSGFMPPAG
jgi:hypothetical protein